MKSLLAVLILTVFSFQSVGQINGTIQHDGITRDYIVYLPTTLSPAQTPTGRFVPVIKW